MYGWMKKIRSITVNGYLFYITLYNSYFNKKMLFGFFFYSVTVLILNNFVIFANLLVLKISLPTTLGLP